MLCTSEQTVACLQVSLQMDERAWQLEKANTILVREEPCPLVVRSRASRVEIVKQDGGYQVYLRFPRERLPYRIREQLEAKLSGNLPPDPRWVQLERSNTIKVDGAGGPASELQKVANGFVVKYRCSPRHFATCMTVSQRPKIKRSRFRIFMQSIAQMVKLFKYLSRPSFFGIPWWLH